MNIVSEGWNIIKSLDEHPDAPTQNSLHETGIRASRPDRMPQVTLYIRDSCALDTRAAIHKFLLVLTESLRVSALLSF